MLLNRVLSIRISGKKRKESVRRLFLDLAHFKNLWIILIKRYKELYGYYPTDQSILYGLIADKEYSPKKEERLKKFKEVRENILKDEKLLALLKALKEQKRKVDNNYLLQQVIRDIIKSFKSYRKADDQIKVLNGVNLEVHPGEFIAVQGASGCGKTTLLLIAGGILHPNDGQVFFEKENIYRQMSKRVIVVTNL